MAFSNDLETPTRTTIRPASQEERVILVDRDDNPLSDAEKLSAHRSNLLHRAFSILLFNEAGLMLLQRRSLAKYHSPGLWTNACCGHPRPNEGTATAASRRLREELGIGCALTYRATFHYQADLGDAMFENEIVHVFAGTYGGTFMPNAEEVAEIAWHDPSEIRRSVRTEGERYTAWFRKYIEQPWFDALDAAPLR